MTDKKYSMFSIFTGAGGLDLGLEGDFTFLKKYYDKTGIETKYACDIFEPARIAFDKFWDTRNKTKMTLKSIIDVVKEFEEDASKIPSVDIVTGGFPCQDFSLAGNRGGFSSNKDHHGNLLDENCDINECRGMLYYWMVKAVQLISPKIFIAENVKGLLSINGAVNRIFKDFSDIGYTVSYKVLNAADFGVPQNRERVIFIGLNNKLIKPNINLEDIENCIISLHPELTHYKNKRSPKYITCRKAFVGLKEPEKSKDISQQKYSKAKFLSKGQGQTEIDVNNVAPTIRSEHHGNIEYRRLSQKHGGKNIKELNKRLSERRLSVRECARLQSFPDNYNFVQNGVSASSAYKLIGNAVPPVFGHAIGEKITYILDNFFGELYE